MNDPNPELAPAKALLERVQRRQLYPCAGTAEFDFTKAGMYVFFYYTDNIYYRYILQHTPDYLLYILYI